MKIRLLNVPENCVLKETLIEETSPFVRVHLKQVMGGIDIQRRLLVSNFNRMQNEKERSADLFYAQSVWRSRTAPVHNIRTSFAEPAPSKLLYDMVSFPGNTAGLL